MQDLRLVQRGCGATSKVFGTSLLQQNFYLRRGAMLKLI
jgi:hypothetical protein